MQIENSNFVKDVHLWKGELGNSWQFWFIEKGLTNGCKLPRSTGGNHPDPTMKAFPFGKGCFGCVPKGVLKQPWSIYIERNKKTNSNGWVFPPVWKHHPLPSPKWPTRSGLKDRKLRKTIQIAARSSCTPLQQGRCSNEKKSWFSRCHVWQPSQ